MGDMMPKEQADYINDIQQYCLDATNMTEQEAYNFAFRCWQLGFVKKKHLVKKIFEEIEQATKNHGITYAQRKIAELKKKYTEGRDEI